MRQIVALSRDQSVSIRRNSVRMDGLVRFAGFNLQQFGTIWRAATDCCIIAGSICNNSAQFGALRPNAALSRVQSVTIQSNSARCNGLVHFAGSICNNSAQFGALRQIAPLSRNQSVTIRRAATDCCTFTGSICNNSAPCDRLHHFRGTNL